MDKKAVPEKGVVVYEKGCKLKEPLGLCARPAAIIIKKAISLGVEAGDVFIKRLKIIEGMTSVADITNIISLMMLAIPKDTELVVFTYKAGYERIIDQLAKSIEEIEL